jgi:hypothetical protein
MRSIANSPSKALIAVLCCAAPIPVFAAIWIMLDAGSRADSIARLALGLGILLVTALVAHRAFESCSIKLDDAGVEQIKVMSSRRFFVKRRLAWNEVTVAIVQDKTYLLKGAGFEVPIHLIVFSDPVSVVSFVKRHLPSHLTAQAA